VTIRMAGVRSQEHLSAACGPDPRANGRMVTFFVAWWLNTATL
jgi:hypothetical protein